MTDKNIFKLEINNETKHLEKHLRSQWTWKTYTSIISFILSSIFLLILLIA